MCECAIHTDTYRDFFHFFSCENELDGRMVGLGEFVEKWQKKLLCIKLGNLDGHRASTLVCPYKLLFIYQFSV